MVRTRVVQADDEAGVAEAVALLEAGEVIALPTETVYGLAGHAFEPAALVRIFEAKERPRFDPLIVHIAAPAGAGRPFAALQAAALIDEAQLSAVARQRLERLADAFWPGPLTLVAPKQERVPDLATSGLATVAVRMPRHPAAQAVLGRCGFALAAPSANRFGRISPTSAADVLAELDGRIPLVLDGGPCEVGLESTVLAVAPDGTLRLLRPGAVTAEQIAAVEGLEPLVATSPVVAGASDEEAAARAPEAPGMLARHYAPHKPLWLLPAPVTALPPQLLPWLRSWIAKRGDAIAEVALLTFSDADADAAQAKALFASLAPQARLRSFSLSRSDLGGAAQRLFATLREMDASNADVLFAEPPPPPHNTGLAAAIKDRLTRAAAGTEDTT